LKHHSKIFGAWSSDQYIGISIPEMRSYDLKELRFWVEEAYAIAAAIEIPSAADFPLPLPAVRATVDRSVFSLMASINVRTAFAWSIVFAKATRTPDGGVLAKDAFSSARSGESPSGALGKESGGPSAVTGSTFSSIAQIRITHNSLKMAYRTVI